MCLVVDHIKAYFLDTRSNMNIIKSFDFSDKINDENDRLLGCISPNEEEAVFSLSNYLYFIDLNEKMNSTKAIKSFVEFQGTFISWRNKGIFIGTEKGGALLMSNDKISYIKGKGYFGLKSSTIIFDSINSEKLKLDAIKLILPLLDEKYIIIDFNHKGIIISNNNIKIIGENIESLKQFSNDNFLIHLQNYNRLAVINSSNELVSSLPPCFFLTKEKKNILLDKNLIE